MDETQATEVAQEADLAVKPRARAKALVAAPVVEDELDRVAAAAERAGAAQVIRLPNAVRVDN